ncbi:aromatic amino acid lyase, partial [Rhodococcus hoagii]|nr:aromatic amino acid lyase [Prescottella equi]
MSSRSASDPSRSRTSSTSSHAAARVRLTDDALAEIARSRARIEDLAADPRPVYACRPSSARSPPGTIPQEMRTQLQRSLAPLTRRRFRSRGGARGRPCADAVAPSTLATGRTGVRPEVAQAYADLLTA